MLCVEIEVNNLGFHVFGEEWSVAEHKNNHSGNEFALSVPLFSSDYEKLLSFLS